MTQSRKMSLVESLANVAIGYGVAVGAQILIFPLFGLHVPLHDNLMIGGLFTVVSIVRSYVVRRAFNAMQQRRRDYSWINSRTVLAVHKVKK